MISSSQITGAQSPPPFTNNTEPYLGISNTNQMASNAHLDDKERRNCLADGQSRAEAFANAADVLSHDDVWMRQRLSTHFTFDDSIAFQKLRDDTSGDNEEERWSPNANSPTKLAESLERSRCEVRLFATTSRALRRATHDTEAFVHSIKAVVQKNWIWRLLGALSMLLVTVTVLWVQGLSLRLIVARKTQGRLWLA